MHYVLSNVYYLTLTSNVYNAKFVLLDFSNINKHKNPLLCLLLDGSIDTLTVGALVTGFVFLIFS